MIPSIGRIVHYTLDSNDVGRINAQRSAHRDLGGNPVATGDVFPMMITRVWASPAQVTEQTAVQGQVFLDGNDALWVTSVSQGDGERQWHQPGRVGLNAPRKTARKWTEHRDTYSIGRQVRALMRIGLTRNQAADVVAERLKTSKS